MLFRRKRPEEFGEKLRVLLWPRRSFGRSFRYVSKRVLRLTATPHAVAAGVAAGAFASFTPFLGFHFVLSFLLAWMLAGNMAAAALGTAVGNPLTFPFIWVATLTVGRTLLPGQEEGLVRHDAINQMFGELSFSELWKPMLEPMIIGAFVIGIPFSLALYFVVRRATAAFRERRRHRLAEKARKRAYGMAEAAG